MNDRMVHFISIGFFILFTHGLMARQIEPDVQVTLEKLPLEKRNQLQNFANDIEAYLENVDYTGEELEEPIPVKVVIFLQDASASYEDRYNGTILVSNGEDIQYYDKYWKFPYQQGTPLMHQEGSYDPFTGLIDFYVYLVIAAEYDKYGKLLGSPFFDKAKLISQQASFDAQYSRGWKERQEVIDYLYGETYQKFRIMKDAFYEGISLIGNDDREALERFTASVNMLKDILYDNPDNSDAINFLKSHHIDLVEIFKGNEEILSTLAEIDPERRETYESYKQ